MIYVFLHDGYADWEIGFLLPELVAQKVPVTTFALTRDPVRSMGALRVTPDLAIDEVDPAKARALILPGGTHWVEFSSPKLDALVRAVRARGTASGIGAICDATGYLGRLGLLDEVAHASNGPDFLNQFAPGRYRGAAHYRDVMAVRDGALVTANGFGALEFTREMLALLGIGQPVSGHSYSDYWYQWNRHGHGG